MKPTVETGTIIKGKLPPRAYALVKEWSAKYKDQSIQDWELARKHKELKWIPGLE